MITPAGGDGRFFWLLPTGEVGLMVTSRWESWFQGYSPLFWGKGGLHDYSPLGKRVGFWVTSR